MSLTEGMSRMNRQIARGIVRGVTLLLTASLLISLSLKGQLLCIGADGHVEVEVAYGSSCDAPRTDPSRGAESTLLDSGHCGPCLDVLILNEEFLVKDEGGSWSPLPAGLVERNPAPEVLQLSRLSHPETATGESGARVFLSSVRLLI